MTDTFTAQHRGGSGSPLVCIHGLVDTWRTWELVLPDLERDHDVLAPTQAGHAGGPAIEGSVQVSTLADAIERAMDGAGFETADIVGNSLGGFVALQLAERGRARSVVALAPGGGWPVGDAMQRERHEYFVNLREGALAAAPQADAIVATPEGRRAVTDYTTVNYEHIPADLLAHQIRGVAGCEGLPALMEYVDGSGWELDPAALTCPIRVVWGTEDRVLPWPKAATRFREEWLPDADWVELAGVGHCPQLDVPERTVALVREFID